MKRIVTLLLIMLLTFFCVHEPVSPAYLYEVGDTIRYRESKCMVVTKIWCGSEYYQVRVLYTDSLFIVRQVDLNFNF